MGLNWLLDGCILPLIFFVGRHSSITVLNRHGGGVVAYAVPKRLASFSSLARD